MSKIDSMLYARHNGNISRLTEELIAAQRNVNECIKYDSVSAVAADGLTSTLDNAKGTLYRITGLQLICSRAQMTLGRQDEALTQIRDIAAQFSSDAADVQKGTKDRAAVSNQALKDIAHVLNQTTEDGTYLFGGIVGSAQPVKDLTDPNNLNIDQYDGVNTSYANTSSTPIALTISDQLPTLTVGNISVGNKAFAQIIGAINFFKRNNPGDEARAEEGLRQGGALLNGLSENARHSLKEIDNAKDINAKVEADTTKLISEIFHYTPDVVAQRFVDVITRYKAAIYSEQGVNSILSRAMEALGR